MKAYAIGVCDYDCHVGLPIAIYCTLDAAKAHIPDAEWEEAGDRFPYDWIGSRAVPDSRFEDLWAIAEFEIQEERP